MKAAIVEASGQTPRHADFAEPEAGPGEAIVRVAASALAPLTRARAAGTHYSSAGQFPFVAGVDGVGRLEDGRRVYFLLPRAPFGALAERAAVALGHMVPVPDGLDDVRAAVIANPGMSSWAALTERARIRTGETVLVNGATGASGRLAVRIARHLGAGRVIATGRNRAVLERCGADAIVPLVDDPDALEQSLRPHFAQGVDIVLDYLWSTSARALLAVGAKEGKDGVPLRIVQIGNAGGPEIPLPAAVLRSAAIELMGSGLGSVTTDRLMGAVGGVFAAATVADLDLESEALPLADVEAGWTRRDAAGRVVFTIDAA